ncbi:MAG: hypothetical protein PHG82_02220 [Candidatus Gracilibacteria bacterium]|nr:hypothetical protein [Candidatus Gracilibacteria bacterium]
MAKAKANIHQEEVSGGIILTSSDIAHLAFMSQNADEETKRRIEKVLLTHRNPISNIDIGEKSEENENIESIKTIENDESIETKILNSDNMEEIINLIYNLVLEKHDKSKILELAMNKDINSRNPELNAKIIKIEEYVYSTKSI